MNKKGAYIYRGRQAVKEPTTRRTLPQERVPPIYRGGWLPRNPGAILRNPALARRELATRNEFAARSAPPQEGAPIYIGVAGCQGTHYEKDAATRRGAYI